jgi:putative inorganic carbon (hco3(-)) transporter
VNADWRLGVGVGGSAATLEVPLPDRGAAWVRAPARVAGWGAGRWKSVLAVALAVLYPFHTYVANVNVSAGDGVVALIGAILMFRFAAGRVALPRYTVHAFALWLVIILSLTVNSLVPSGFFGLVAGAVEVGKYLAAVAWMIALYWLLSGQLPRRLVVFAAASVIMASWFAAGTVYSNLFLHEQRPTGPFENPNIYGNYLVLNFFLALAAANVLAEDRGGRLTHSSVLLRSARPVALLVALPVLSVGILATGSRGTLVGLVAGLLVGLRLRPPTAFGPRKLLAGLVGGVALLVAVAWFLEHHPYLLARLGRTGSTDPNVEHRLALWRAALDAWYAHPLLGIGYGQFTSYAGYLRLWKAQVAHQTYLSMAAELGLLGLSVFLWLLRSVIRDSWRARPVVGSRLGRLFCGFVVATSVQGFFTNVDQFRSLWIIFGAVAALLVYARGARGEVRAPSLNGDHVRPVRPARIR